MKLSKNCKQISEGYGDNYDLSRMCFWSNISDVPTAAEWYRYRIVAGFVTSSSPVPIKTHSVGHRCTLNLSRTEVSSYWCRVVVRRGGSSSGVVHVT
ncbi:uncharacterized protein TNCV_2541891 [Trichonephila clavipes]|nr:uncharacterized protein TNCV_2541891 [Trichonephila clavipes]